MKFLEISNEHDEDLSFTLEVDWNIPQSTIIDSLNLHQKKCMSTVLQANSSVVDIGKVYRHSNQSQTSSPFFAYQHRDWKDDLLLKHLASQTLNGIVPKFQF